MKRRVHIKFNSRSSITITNYLRQKSFDLNKIKTGFIIDLVSLKVYSSNNIKEDARFVAQLMKGTDEKGKLTDAILDIAYRAKKDENWRPIGEAQMNRFYYSYKNANDTVNKSNEGTYEVTILD